MCSVLYKLYLKLLRVKYGKNLALKGIPVIYNVKGATLSIGDDCVIKSSFLSNLVGLYSKTIIVTRTPNASIRIGNRVGISGATIYARSKIEIGDDTNIGGNVKLLDNDFHPIDPMARVKDDKEKIGTKPITIGNNCFIGCNSLILKGTVLGNNCVVGAGSVVTGVFGDNCIIAGNPARLIRTIKPGETCDKKYGKYR